MLGTGCLLLAPASVTASYPSDLFVGLFVFGAGLGACSVAGVAALSGVAQRDAGLASGLNTAAFQIGGAFGIAVVSSVVLSRTVGPEPPVAMTAGFRAGLTAWVVLAGVGLLVALLLPPAAPSGCVNLSMTSSSRRPRAAAGDPGPPAATARSGREMPADDDKKRAAHEAVVVRVRDGDGTASRASRRAAFDNAELDEPLRTLVGKVARQPTRVTDEDIDAAKASGLTEDQIFEVVVCAAVGQATRQYQAALAALAEATTGQRGG
jgi:hypothetical protein